DMLNSLPGRGTRMAILVLSAVSSAPLTENAFAAGAGPQDPGVRGGSVGAGGPVSGLDTQSMAFFQAGLAAFNEVEGVTLGLGPRLNLDRCGGCHAQPAVGRHEPGEQSADRCGRRQRRP